MAIELDMRSADFEQRFEALLGAKRESAVEVDEAVAAIIADVRARGDEAVSDYSRRFDRVDIEAKGLRVVSGRDRRRDLGLRAGSAEGA